jgi:hypothetical protein
MNSTATKAIANVINQKRASSSATESVARFISENSGTFIGMGVGGVGGALIGRAVSAPEKKTENTVLLGLVGMGFGARIGRLNDRILRQDVLQKFASDSIVLSPRAKPKGLRSSDLIDPSTGAFLLADGIGLNSFGSARAGRAETMASSMGQEVPYRVSHPRAFGSLVVGGGAVGGAALGAALGGVTGAFVRGDNPDGTTHGNARGGALIGGLIGTYAGMVTGAVSQFILRRKEMNRITKDFDNYHGKLTPTVRKGNLLGLSASHARGREEAFRAILGGDRKMRGSTTENIATFLGPFSPIPTIPVSPFIVNDSNNNMAEIARRDGAYGFQKNMEKFASAPGTIAPTLTGRRRQVPQEVPMPVAPLHKLRHLGQKVKEDPRSNPAWGTPIMSSPRAMAQAGAAAAAVSRTPEFLERINNPRDYSSNQDVLLPLAHTLEQTPAGYDFGRTGKFNSGLTARGGRGARGLISYDWKHHAPTK